ncbi:MAG: NAD(P)/FAD-dependent oxidoreductase [Desulfobulbaceae bacterium]|nr:NAD(P)/FAD-dependent oxidoreductase [Desulfobulbaceae bacterium]
MSQRRVIIIGGGPAGLMAAGRAAEAGAETLVLEKMKRPGRKLCITGKGRCNITNIAEIKDFLAHFSTSGKFLRQAFHQFFNTDLIKFLEQLGLELVFERGGRVFPASGKAPDVLKVLLEWARNCGVEMNTTSPVEKLLTHENRVTGVVSGGRTLHCHAIVLATGGASYPVTGSTGDGYLLAEALGHSIVPIRPALVPLVTAGDIAGKMAELNLRNILVRLYINGKKRREAFGEVVFAAFGLTGPAILTLSSEIVDAILDKDKVTVSLDLKPALDEKKLDARLLRDFETRGKEDFSSVLRGLLPREMVPVCIEQTGIGAERKVNTITAKERRRLRVWLKDFRFEITGHRPFAEAIVTAGGINTREIDPRTMESRLIKGLYLAGEVLDIQGDTGGYNLQAAFSTGWLAGHAAAKAD